MREIRILDDCPIDVYEVRENMKYGIIEHQTYRSRTTGLERGVSVLLPGEYDGTVKYPVMYLLHGIFGDEYSLSGDSNNRLLEILGNQGDDRRAAQYVRDFGS